MMTSKRFESGGIVPFAIRSLLRIRTGELTTV